MAKKYRAALPALEREELAALLARGKADVCKPKHAQVLLQADEAGDGAGHGPGWCGTRIAEAVGVGVATVQRLRQRFVEEGFLEVHHTPKHGSWLNRAAIELAALGRQRLARRMAQHDTLRRPVATWEKQRNSAQPKITRQFTTRQARIKLKSLYPAIDG